MYKYFVFYYNILHPGGTRILENTEVQVDQPFDTEGGPNKLIEAIATSKAVATAYIILGAPPVLIRRERPKKAGCTCVRGSRQVCLVCSRI